MSRSRYGSCCVAVDCSMRSGTNLMSTIKMFHFPKDDERRNLWIKAVRRKDWKPSYSSRLCSLHFITRAPSKDPNHPDWVPSIFAYNENVDFKSIMALERYERFLKRNETTTTSVVQNEISNNISPTTIKIIDPVTGGLWTPTETSKICGRHFPPEAYKIFPKKKQLYPGVVPTIFEDYPAYMQNRLLTKNYKKNPDEQEVQKHLSLQSRIIKLNVDQTSRASSRGNESSSSCEMNLENQDSPLLSCSSNVIATKLANNSKKSLDLNSDESKVPSNSFRSNLIMLRPAVTQELSNDSSNINDPSLNNENESYIAERVITDSDVDINILTPSVIMNENDQMDVSDNDKSDTVLAAVVLPPDQSVKVHKVKDADKQQALKHYIGRCPCDSMLKMKLRSAQKDSQRLRGRIERLREENADLSSALRRANNLIKTYCIEKLQEGIEDEDSEAILLKNQLVAYAKKKRDW